MAGRVRKTQIDPTTIRLSEHFLLSDFMGCNSVYTKGLKNIWDGDDGKLAEGTHLCATLLEPILSTYGPASVSYGYISPALSKQIVTYQDPDMPSYHRWDKGAAADLCVHAWVKRKAPIFLAHEIDQTLDYSRMITYSESPFICLATQISEGSSPRKAFYENRYCGKKGAKPQYIRKSNSSKVKAKEAETLVLEFDWKGAGYPTYHGGGIRQLHHNRVSRYSVVSDFLYSTYAIREGVANVPDLQRFAEQFRQAGATYDSLLEKLDVPKLSIVRGFESFRFNDYPLFSWKDNFAIDFKPPSYLSANDIATAAQGLPHVVSVGVDNTTGTARIIGKPIQREGTTTGRVSGRASHASNRPKA